jgi:hypothetical protein
MELTPLSRRLQLPVPLGVDLLLMPGEAGYLGPAIRKSSGSAQVRESVWKERNRSPFPPSNAQEVPFWEMKAEAALAGRWTGHPPIWRQAANSVLRTEPGGRKILAHGTQPWVPVANSPAPERGERSSVG